MKSWCSKRAVVRTEQCGVPMRWLVAEMANQPVSKDQSPNSCLPHGVLALNLDNCLACQGFASRGRPHFFHASFLFGSTEANVRHTSLLIFTLSRGVICLRPLLSSTSFKTDSNFMDSWSVPFGFLERQQ